MLVNDMYNKLALITGFPVYTNATDCPDINRFLLEMLSEGLQSTIDDLYISNNVLERNDVIIVASVSCIYGLGLPENYFKGAIKLNVGMELERNELIKNLVMVQYSRNDVVLERSTFRARGDIVEIMPAYEKIITRIYFFGDEIEKIVKIDNLTGEILEVPEETVIYPAVHYISYDENEDDPNFFLGIEGKQKELSLE